MTFAHAHAPQLKVPITAGDANAVAAVLRDPVFRFDAGHGEGWSIMRLFEPGHGTGGTHYEQSSRPGHDHGLAE